MYEKNIFSFELILILKILRNLWFEIEIFEERKFHQEKMEGVATPFFDEFCVILAACLQEVGRAASGVWTTRQTGWVKKYQADYGTKAG